MPTILKIRKDGFKQKYHLSLLRPNINRLYKGGKSARQVGKELNISHARVLQLLKKENVSRRSVTKIIPNKNYKKLIPERAYILGVMCGDGCIFSGMAHKGKWDYKLYIIHLSVKDKDFVDEFMRCIRKVYGIVPSLYYRDRNKLNNKWSNIWVAKISRKKVYDDLSHYKLGTNDWEIPKEIKTSGDLNIIGSFLKGFYDSEGSVLKGPRSFNIVVHSNNLRGLLEIKYLLKKIGIDSCKMMKDKRPNRNPTFFFAILKRKNLEIFLNEVGFSIQRKQNKLIEHLK